MRSTDGIMLVDKPAGMTSHDVVNFMRKALKIRKVGHTGILDPGATGLLVMLLGRGTLFSAHLTKMPKRYVSRIVFGQETDTYDSDGKIVASVDPGKISKTEFKIFLAKFVGEFEQMIPPYSAAKRNGVALHKLARKGEKVTPGHKIVQVDEINIIDFDWPEVSIDIRCQSGTYVRSIAHELGLKIGCGGHLKSLRRLEVGPFQVSAAVTLDEITKMKLISEAIRPLKNALPSSPAIEIKPQYYGAVLNGRPFCKKYINDSDYRGEGGVLSLLMGPEDKVLALARLNLHWKAINKLAPSEIMGTYIRVIDEGRLRA